ncbi:MAG: hypothetical protein QOJ97_2167 [Solirubrobacteraceae bacterium]|nr:hypothetical protein [Solirubrobacteraceae bacterium]
MSADRRPVAGGRPAGERVRELGRRAMVRATRVLFRGYVAALDYPPSADPRPRWGHGRPAHPQLARLLARHEDAYRDTVRTVLEYADDLARIPAGPAPAGEPHWNSRWQPNLDAAVLYALLRRHAPATYVEVGSGVSTAFAARAKQDGGLSTRIVSIDPGPRAPVDADEAIAQPLELTDLSRFEALRASDMVFLDGSHRSFMNSDATVFFLDVLPRLAPGVLVGIHDVLLPEDYPPEWRHWHYNEQYLLAAYLLAEARWLQPVFAARFAGARPELDPLWDRIGVTERGGFAFWLTIRPR